jgi:hypothetical protein
MCVSSLSSLNCSSLCTWIFVVAVFCAVHEIRSSQISMPSVYAAVDRVSGTVFIGESVSPFAVRSFSWEQPSSPEEGKADDDDDAGLQLQLKGDVLRAGTASKARPMTVVPEKMGSSGMGSVLVVGVYGTHRVQIIKLPAYEMACAPVSLGQGIQVVGLAADSAGSTLLVADAASKSVLVIPWPIPGMIDAL